MVNLKERLIERIKATSDADVLREVYRLLELELDDQHAFELTDEQRLTIEQSRQQIALGDFLTNEQSNEATKKWLKER